MNSNHFFKHIWSFGDHAVPAVTLEDKLYRVGGMPDESLYAPQPDYEGLFAHYYIKPTDFREKVAVLADPRLLDSSAVPVSLPLQWVTSVDSLAGRKRLLQDPIYPLSAVGILVTKDNQIVLGTRGGAVTEERRRMYAVGLLATPPGGSVKFKPYAAGIADPFTVTLVDELYEELGVFGLRSTCLLGLLDSFPPGPKGLKVVGVLHTDATFKQIVHKHGTALGIYEQLLSEGATRKNAKHELSAQKLPVDAWEHSSLIALPNNSLYIRRFLDAQTLPSAYNFATACSGGLELYLQHLQKK
ncbi:hypothetical protein HZB02_03705 [Candidatus Woesearchaeota archaeon]|nr:hypothetical protein [Candidatus Woesearchaeota archaeon]